MAIKYDWHINGFDAKISHDSKSNVIYAVHWKYWGKDGDHSSDIIGSEHFEYNADSFIEYDKIKKEDVIGWLEAKLDIAKMKESIKSVIDDKKDPKDIMLIPEW